mgnify:CR=1 FL=1
MFIGTDKNTVFLHSKMYPANQNAVAVCDRLEAPIRGAESYVVCATPLTWLRKAAKAGWSRRGRHRQCVS